MPFEYILYIPIVILVFIILLPKAHNKAFLGIFLLWLFGSPIFLNPRYMISLSFFGFDIQPNRFLFIILTPILLVRLFTPRRLLVQDTPENQKKTRLYEIWLIGYILAIIFAVALNIQHVGSRTAIADISNAITFVVVYFCSKQFINENDFDLFRTAIMIFALMSAVVAAYQFFVNPEFFRLGSFRGAFSGYYRANGLFSAEYDQGLFLTLAIIVTMSSTKKRWIQILCIAIFCGGIFLTMHRLSWVAMIFTLGSVWFFYFRKNWFTNVTVPIFLIIFVIIALNVPWSKLAIGKFGSNLIANRVFADTYTERISQYKFSFYVFKEYPLGIGSFATSFYTQIAYNRGIPINKAEKFAYIVHNGLLSSGIKYGILGMALFSLFILTSIIDFLRHSVLEGKKWYPLLMIILIFLIFNLTNDFSFIGTQIAVTLAWMIGGFVSVNNPRTNPEIYSQQPI